jgi:hypothetical protein
VIETVVLAVCNSTQRFVDKAGMAKLDMAEEGLLASLVEASVHLRGYEMLSDVLLGETYGRHDILLEVEIQGLLTALVVFADAFWIC